MSGELFRYRCGFCANVSSLRCICWKSLVFLSMSCIPPSLIVMPKRGIDKAVEIVPDGITSPQSDPLGNGSVLLLSSRELLLRAKGLVALQSQSHQPRMSLEMPLHSIVIMFFFSI